MCVCTRGRLVFLGTRRAFHRIECTGGYKVFRILSIAFALFYGLGIPLAAVVVVYLYMRYTGILGSVCGFISLGLRWGLVALGGEGENRRGVQTKY